MAEFNFQILLSLLHDEHARLLAALERVVALEQQNALLSARLEPPEPAADGPTVPG